MPSLPRASLADTLAILLITAGPLVAKGLIVRRPKVVRLLALGGAERRGVRLLARMRRKYGDGPLLLRLPFREQAVVLSPRHLRRVLAETPEPFAADSSEKVASLAHFQPDGVLISHGAERAERRRFNEQVLESACPVHSLARSLTALVEAGTAPLREKGSFSWPEFKRAWYRMVRAAVFGAAEREDEALTDTLEQLRANADWAFMKPRQRRLRDSFLAAVRERLAEAEPGSLGALARACETRGSAPEDQVAHWLFAFDAAGMAAFRTLAMLALHPEAAARAHHDANFPRACILETLRLWPTTPAVLRQTTAETAWEGGTLPAGAGLLIHLPYFHRDSSRIPYADRFVPDIWLDGRAEAWPFVPFSAGPASCPARNLVLFLASTWIAALMRDRDVALAAGTSLDPAKLPATFDHFPLRLNFAPSGTNRDETQELAWEPEVDRQIPKEIFHG
ncbi:MAG TPA: cytochrome P450 [Allosphingosinicella sp.]|jgi:cytochrome P450|nr:cytochrome P450 [Allosphingosinicella sp.]